MDRVVQLRLAGTDRGASHDFEGDPAPVWVGTRPTWATRAALLTFLVIVGLPLLILVGFAVVAATLVFGGLVLLAGAGRRLKEALPTHDGRSNVRVKS